MMNFLARATGYQGLQKMRFRYAYARRLERCVSNQVMDISLVIGVSISSTRLWLKIQIGVYEQVLEIRFIAVTGSSLGDALMLPELLNQIPADNQIGSVTAGWVYEKRKCDNANGDFGLECSHTIPEDSKKDASLRMRTSLPEMRRFWHRLDRV